MKKISWALRINIAIFIIIVVLATCFHYCFDVHLEIKGLSEIVNGLLMYLSITIGFFGTSISVLISIMEKDFMKNFFQTDSVKDDFNNIIFIVITTGSLAILQSIVYIIIINNHFDLIYNIYFIGVYIFLIVIYSLNLLYMTFILLLGLSDMVRKL